MLSIFSVDGCECNKTGRISVIPVYPYCLFRETTPRVVPEEVNIPEILFGLCVNSTKYTILEVIHNSNARPLINESCVDMTEL